MYKSDGSFVDSPNDTEFGWYFTDIVIDESAPKFRERNKEIKAFSRMYKSIDKLSVASSSDSIDIDCAEEVEVQESKPNLRVELVRDIFNCENVYQSLSTVLAAEQFRHISSEKERLANNINPCSIEAKMLLSVVYHAKYKALLKKDASENLLKTVNYKTTNFKCLLSDNQSDLSDDIYEEILNYQATKEDNMLSLMMELILTDTDCNINDLVNESESSVPKTNPVIPQFVFETSDLGNSIQSSSSSQDENQEKNYLAVSDKSNILSSIGLSEEYKSIQSFCEETTEMHQELTNIKRSFRVSRFRADLFSVL